MKGLFSNFKSQLVIFMDSATRGLIRRMSGRVIVPSLILAVVSSSILVLHSVRGPEFLSSTQSAKGIPHESYLQTTSDQGRQENELANSIAKRISLGNNVIAAGYESHDLLSEIFVDQGLVARLDEHGDDIESRPDQPDRALEFRLMQMKDEKGEVPIDGLLIAKEQIQEMHSAFIARAQRLGKDPNKMKVAELVPADWAWLGPGNVGGRIRSIVIDPGNRNNIWIGSVGGGIWKSIDAGASWLPVNDFMANLAVSTMVIDPVNTGTMYAGTGEGFTNVDSLGGLGVFRSTDNGTTWNQLASTNPAAPAPAGCGAVGSVTCPIAWTYVTRLAISPDGTTILAGTRNDSNGDGVVDSGGIQRSTDGGATWTTVSNIQVTDVKFNPTNSSWAVAGGLGQGLFSNDGGQTWNNVGFSCGAGCTVSNGGTIATNGRVEIAFAPSAASPAASATVYAAVNNNNGDIYQSTDGGQNFTRVNTGTNFFLGSGNQGWYDNTIWVSPQNAALVVVGGIDLWRSTNSGSSFTQISRWQCGPVTTGNCTGQSAHADQHVIVADPAFDGVNNKRVYFGNDGGIFRTDDITTVAQQSGWTDLNQSLGITQFYGVTWNGAGKFMSGAQDNSTLLYSGDPQNWSTVAQGDGGYTAADPNDPNFLYGETQNLGLFRSTDAGTTQSSINAGISDATCTPPPGGTCNPNTNFIAPFVLDPNDPNTMLAGGQSLWRSTNVKATASPTPTWTAIKPPTAAPNPANQNISAIAVVPQSSDTIIVGHNDGQIYLSQDGTAANPTWARIDRGTPARFVTDLLIDTNHSPVWIYATFGGFTADNVWRSVDLGATWADVSGSGSTGLPSVPVRALTMNPTNPNLLYAGTEVGIFASEDAGATWLIPQAGPANVSVDDLIWQNGYLVAATHGRGVWRTRNQIYLEPFPSQTGGCRAPDDCPCYGDWHCACTWGTHGIPTQNDDVYVGACPILTVRQGATARNVTVSGVGQIIGDVSGSLGITGDLRNGGTISGLLFARSNDLWNVGRIIGGDVESNGDVENYGFMQGNVFYFGAPPPTSTQVAAHISGNGTWRFAAGSIRTGYLAALNSGLNFQMDLLRNEGTLDIGANNLQLSGKFWNFSDNILFQGVRGTGRIRFLPTTVDNLAELESSGEFTPSVEAVSGSVRAHTFGTFNNGPSSIGSLIVDPGATVTVDSSLTVNGDVTNDGAITKFATCSSPCGNVDWNGTTFTNNGSVGNLFFFNFNPISTAKTQQIVGLGSWSPQNVGMGTNTTVAAQNGLIFSSSQFGIPQTSTFDISTRTLVFTGPVNLSVAGKIAGPAGSVKFDTSSSVPRIDAVGAMFEPSLEVATGTLTANGLAVGAKLFVDSGATLRLGGSVSVSGDVKNDGTITSLGDQTFTFLGGTLANNGAVGSSVYTAFGAPFGGPATQSLSGTGTWTGAKNLYVFSNTNLLNDVTYDGSGVWVYSTCTLNTGANTLTVPCTATFGQPFSYTGDVIGNVRRTNIPNCTGPIAFGNVFTTIDFSGGTAPNDVLVNITRSAPVGFPTAIGRSYMITPAGGSGWTATLRLHYLDSELNGNNESSLSLYRNDGASWNIQGATNRNITDNWVEYAGVTQFSPWTLSSNTPPPPTPTVTPTPSPTPTSTPIPTPTPSPSPTPTPTPVVSQITASSVSCAQFNSGTAVTLNSAQYSIKSRNNTIGSVSPNTITYWLQVDALSGSNSVVIDQSITTANFSKFWNVSKGSTVYSGNCGNSIKGTFSQAPNGSITVSWRAASAGRYIILLKLGVNNFTRQPVPDPSTVHFDFSSPGIPDSSHGIDLVGPSAVVSELFPYFDDNWYAKFLLRSSLVGVTYDRDEDLFRRE